MRMRLDPADEYMHPPGDDGNFNESVYFNLFDPGPKLGAWFRIGNRVNEGYAEVTSCIYLPDGKVGFMFSRPHIDSNEGFDAGGMRYTVIEPFKHLRLSFQGPLAVLDHPLAMKDPRAAFAGAPQVNAEMELDYRALSPMWGGEPEREEGDAPFEGMEFARGHFEQHVGGRGQLTVGDNTWDVDGYGLRDHSWGPRWWQAPLWYRWLTGNAGEDKGFMVSIVANRNGSVRRTGVMLENGEYSPINDATITTEWTTEDRYHQGVRCIAQTLRGDVIIEGQVRSLIPLRHRRAEEMTRISEGLTEWRWDGSTGCGMSEYLDQIVDGRPAGD
jgi:hypothetical protein